jgi:quercetin dioxygenase-like cupin family protein
MSKAYLTYAASPIVLALSTLSVGGTCLVAQEHIRQAVVEVPAPQDYSTMVEVHIRQPASSSALGAPHAAARMPAIGPETGWAIAPWFFPTGAEITFVDGNPNIDEAFLVRLAFPKNYRIPPHYHGTDIHVEVQQGAMAIGLGDRMDLHQTRVLAAGDTASVQAGTHYYFATSATTLIAMRSRGPFTLTYVHPDDDPSRHLPLGR